jgi:hypothetical protein
LLEWFYLRLDILFLLNDLLIWKLVTKLHIFHDEVLEDPLELLGVITDKHAISEASTFVEYVVVRLYIKNITFLGFILIFNFVFDHKCHVWEWHREVLSCNHPVVIHAIEFLASIFTKGNFLIFLKLHLAELIESVSHKACPHVHHGQALVTFNIWSSKLIEQNSMVKIQAPKLPNNICSSKVPCESSTFLLVLIKDNHYDIWIIVHYHVLDV